MSGRTTGLVIFCKIRGLFRPASRQAKATVRLLWLPADKIAGLIVVLTVLIGELFDGSFGLCELPMVYRNPAWPPRLVIAALAIEIGLVWLLAREFGAVGAALGFAIAMLALAAMRIAMVRQLYGFTVIGMRHLGLIALAIGTLLVSGLIIPAAT